MVHGSKLMAHASRLVVKGSWLMAKKDLAVGPPGPGPSAKFFSINQVPKFQNFEASKSQNSEFPTVKSSENICCKTFDSCEFEISKNDMRQKNGLGCFSDYLGNSTEQEGAKVINNGRPLSKILKTLNRPLISRN